MKSKPAFSRIFLLGMPSAGKTTLGRKLADEWGYSFFDLDSEIVGSEGVSIPEIFQKRGEKEFRELEKAALHRLASKESIVVATGGGAPCFHDNLDFMKSAGLTVFLQVPEDTLVNRLSARTGRPMFDEVSEVRQKVRELWTTRKDVYLQSDILVEESSIEVIKKQIERFARSAN